jgi:hypothetical protein
MQLKIDLLGATFLLTIFVALLALSYPSSSKTRPKKVKKERRAYPRYKTSLRIKYKTPLEEGISWIKDISMGGAQLFLNKTLKSLRKGQSLEIEIDLPYEAQPVFVRGNIVWAKGENGGFRFNKVLQGDLNRILQYIQAETEEPPKDQVTLSA